MPSGHPRVVLWSSGSVAELYWSLKTRFKALGFDLGQLTASGCPAFQRFPPRLDRRNLFMFQASREQGVKLPQRQTAQFSSELAHIS
jgi:hypothetical protein